MRDHPDPLARLADPATLAAIDGLDRARLAALLTRISAITARASARLAALADDRPVAAPDRLLDVKAAAGL